MYKTETKRVSNACQAVNRDWTSNTGLNKKHWQTVKLRGCKWPVMNIQCFVLFNFCLFHFSCNATFTFSLQNFALKSADQVWQRYMCSPWGEDVYTHTTNHLITSPEFHRVAASRSEDYEDYIDITSQRRRVFLKRLVKIDSSLSMICR